MRKKEREIKDIAEIEEIIQKAKVCRIAMVAGDEPYVVPVCFGYEKGAFYVHGANAGRKIEILKKNNRVCLEMDADVEIVAKEKACDFSTRYRSVIGTGKAHILKKDEEKRHGLNAIMKHYAGREFSFTKKDLDSVLVWKVEIETLSGKKANY